MVDPVAEAQKVLDAWPKPIADRDIKARREALSSMIALNRSLLEPLGDEGRDLVGKLRADKLAVCPFDRRSPDYWTTPNDKPCVMCGGEPEGPDKCTGADLRVMDDAAAYIERQAAALSVERERVRQLEEALDWIDDQAYWDTDESDGKTVQMIACVTERILAGETMADFHAEPTFTLNATRERAERRALGEQP